VADELEPLFALVSERTGSALSKQQRERVTRAVQPMLRTHAPAALVTHLERREGAVALLELLSAVSVHKTDLFRDEAQLEALEQHVLAPLAQTGRALQLWSAGCATGEEAATLVLLLAKVGANPASRVLATDLSPAALELARRFTFADEAMRRVPKALATAHFERRETGWVLSSRLARQVRFSQHNLTETPYPFPESGTVFDVIVCRNVLIYFTPEAAERTVGWLAERLGPAGTLVLSAAEPILKPRADLVTLRVGATFFYAPRGSAPVEVSEPPPVQVPPQLPEPVRVARMESAVTEPPPPSAVDEGEALFSLVLDWSAAGQSDPETEAGLRKALYLAPELASARYCLGLLLERQGQRADATTEYRRALADLEGGRARSTAFFLNPDRLMAACRVAISRLS